MEQGNLPNTHDNECLPAGTPVLDMERYRARIEEDFDNADAADAFLTALWQIMCAFVDLGLNVKSSTEKLPFLREMSSEFSAAAPESEHTEQRTEKTPPTER